MYKIAQIGVFDYEKYANELSGVIAAVKDNNNYSLAKEELLKYIDFPEWMPVTKDGKFDEKQAEKMFDDAGMNTLKNQTAFLDYKTAVEKGANMC